VRAPPTRRRCGEKTGFRGTGRHRDADGGYVYDRRIVARLRGSVGTWPCSARRWLPWLMPRRARRRASGSRRDRRARGDRRARLRRAAGAGAGFLQVAGRDRARPSPARARDGLTGEQAGALRDSERRALAAARHVIVTSDATARTLVADYEVATDRVSVVRPGNDPAVPAQGSRDGTLALLSVGTLVPRKGHDICSPPWRGSPTGAWRPHIVGERRDAATAAKIEPTSRGSVSARGVVLAAPWRRNTSPSTTCGDLFVLATRTRATGWHSARRSRTACDRGNERRRHRRNGGRRGRPAGAAGRRGGADRGAAPRARQPATRARLAAGARATAARLPRWDEQARLFATVIEELR